jgi:hypothetical protein
MQLVVFALGDEEYGLPITQVQEIIRFSEPRSIPNPHASIRGVINLRGRIIPVCDLKLQLDVHAAERPDSACEIVIVESFDMGIREGPENEVHLAHAAMPGTEQRPAAARVEAETGAGDAGHSQPLRAIRIAGECRLPLW